MTDYRTVKRRGFLTTSLQTFGSQLGVAILSLGNVLVVARVLGPEGRGQVAFLTAIALFTSNLSTWGIQEANVNLAGTEPEARPSLATNSIFFSFLLGIAGAGVVTILAWRVPAITGDANDLLLALTLASIPGLILYVYLRFLIQGDYGFRVTNLAALLPAVINVGVNATLALAGVLSVGAAVGTWVGGQLLSTAILVWYVAARAAGFGRPDVGLAHRTLHFGIRSHAGRIMLVANYRLDQWILGAIAGARELGLYSVAVAWAEALFLLPTALSAVQRPDLVRATAREAVRLTARVFRVSLVITLVCASALVLAAPILCVTFFGQDFRGSIDDLRVLAAGAFGIVALKQLGSALTARHKPTLASAAISSAFASTVVLDFLLIPDHGGVGAAVASAVSYTLGGIVVVAVFLSAIGGTTRDFLPTRGDADGAWRLLMNRIRRPAAEDPVLDEPVDPVEPLGGR